MESQLHRVIQFRVQAALPEKYSNPSAPLDTKKYLSRKGAKIANETVGNAAARGAFAALREKNIVDISTFGQSQFKL